MVKASESIQPEAMQNPLKKPSKAVFSKNFIISPFQIVDVFRVVKILKFVKV